MARGPLGWTPRWAAPQKTKLQMWNQHNMGEEGGAGVREEAATWGKLGESDMATCRLRRSKEPYTRRPDEYGGARDEIFSFWRRSSEIRMTAWKSTPVAGMRASFGERVMRSV